MLGHERMERVSHCSADAESADYVKRFTKIFAVGNLCKVAENEKRKGYFASNCSTASSKRSIANGLTDVVVDAKHLGIRLVAGFPRWP